MNYSIIINPLNQNSQASIHAYMFVKAILQKEIANINVFFYGYAVKSVFFNNIWDDIGDKVELIACSTVAEKHGNVDLQIQNNVQVVGLGQWMEAVIKADKRVEFV